DSTAQIAGMSSFSRPMAPSTRRTVSGNETAPAGSLVPLLASCVRHRDSLPGSFAVGGSRDMDQHGYVLEHRDVSRAAAGPCDGASWPWIEVAAVPGTDQVADADGGFTPVHAGNTFGPIVVHRDIDETVRRNPDEHLRGPARGKPKLRRR